MPAGKSDWNKDNKICKILVIGATGGVGGATFQHLLQRLQGREIIAGVRNVKKAKEKLGEAATIRQIDLDDSSTFSSALAGIDSLFLLTGYSVNMLKQSMAILKEARTAGVKHVVHVGASTAETTKVDHWCWHRYVESYIEQLGFTYTHLRPESFMQNMWVYGWLHEGAVICYTRGGGRWGWVDCDDVAQVASKVLLHPERHAGKIIPLAGDAKSFEEVADILSQELGKEIKVDYKSPEEFWEGVKKAVTDINVLVYMQCVYNQMKLGAKGPIAGADRVYDDYADILGRPATKWSDFVRKNREQLLKVATPSSG